MTLLTYDAGIVYSDYSNDNKTLQQQEGRRKNPMNEKIKKAREKAGLKQWQVAELAGYREDKFSRMLRHELPEEEQIRIIKLIENWKG